MKLSWLAADIASARRATSFLVALLVGSMLVNLVLAIFALRLAGHERVVLVPPDIHKTFWVDAERVSGEYLEQMAYFLVQLTLDVTPANIDHQSRLLLQYAAPGAYGELRSTLLAAAERLKHDSAATIFSARDLVVDAAQLKVGVRGQLITFISDRRVAEASKAYALEFEYIAGRLFLKSFRETTAHDPLETQPHPVPAASPAGTGADTTDPR